MYDFVFMVSIFDLIYNPKFETLCTFLNVEIKSKWLEEEYNNIMRGQGDTYLFHSQIGCLLLDLFQEPTDQNEMVLVGIRCRKEVHTQIKSTVKAIYDEAPVKSTRINEGTGVLDRLVSAENYPIIIPTITDVDGKETYEFFQNLKVFSS